MAAGEWHAAARAKIQQYIARHHPKDALRVTDYMDTLMLGLSAKAREGIASRVFWRPCGWQAWRWSVSCRPEWSDSLSARDFDPLGGYPAVIVTQQAGDHRPNILGNAHPSQRRHRGKLRVNPASSRTSPPPKSVAIAPGAMVLTVMPRPPSSRAMYTLSISTAALAAA